MMHKFLKFAQSCALGYEYDDTIEFKLCAVIVRGGNVLSVGFNQSKTNAFVERYTDHVKGFNRSFSLSTHAEMSAIAQVRSKSDLTGSKMFVVRLRPEKSKCYSSVGLARPCAICQNILVAYGIKRAYYTINDHEYGVMKPFEHAITDKLINAYNKEQV